jgi:hypothetical protein
MVKVLGFDVGIKNLAYCIVEKQEDKYIIQPSHVDNWNIINLTEQDKLKCCYETCTNSIGLCSEINKQTYHFCSKHKLYHKVLLSKNPLIFNECTDQTKCSHAASCKTKSKFIYNDNCLCAKHKDMIEKNENKSRSLIKYKIFVKDFTIHNLKLSLLQKLDIYKDIFLNVDVVCIENQPTFKNPTMKAISDVLYTWFMIRGLIEKEQNKSTISKITFFAPSNKLKIAGKTEGINEEIEDATKVGNKYKKTKELGITNCMEFIKHNPDYVTHLNSFKKKDDLCDAFLHGVHYIDKNLECENKAKKKVEKEEQVKEQLVKDEEVKKIKRTKKVKENVVKPEVVDVKEVEEVEEIVKQTKKAKKVSKKIVNKVINEV